MTAWTAEEAARELLAVLPFLNRMIAAELHEEAGEETTMPQFRVLGYLNDKPQTLSAIARQRRVSLQSAGELVQALIERGWIARTPDPGDRRQSLLSLTALGQTKYQHAWERMVRRLTPFMQQLTETEMDAVRLALPVLHRVLSGEPEHDR
jgi:DNA-binding MarR family transcriptional regulator